MDEAALADRYRTRSRRALMASILAVVAVASVLAWNARRLEGVEAELARQAAELSRLAGEREGLDRTLRSLKDDPEGGVRAMAQRTNTTDVMHDFFLWVDVRSLGGGDVAEVRYEFEHEGYEPVTSRLAATGFGAYFRGPMRPGQPVCPGRTRVSIGFEDGSRKLVDYDLCAAVGLS